MPPGPYGVVLRPAAQRSLRRLDRLAQRRVLDGLEGLRDDPRPTGVKALQGVPGLLRLRVDSYRILYQVQDAQGLILVVTVGHRREVYRTQ